MARDGECREGKHRNGHLAVCLMALGRGEDDVDAKVGAFAIAEFINLVREFLTKKK